MTANKAKESDLVAAAGVFEESLALFERMVRVACQNPLDSQQNLQRTARAFEGLGVAEKQLSEAALQLGERLSEARARQEARADAVQTRAREFELRTQAASELIVRYGAIGDKAKALNVVVVQLAEREATGHSAELVADLGAVRARMDEVVADAALLVTVAKEAQFLDIAQLVDSLRQQMASAAAKVATLTQSLTST